MKKLLLLVVLACGLVRCSTPKEQAEDMREKLTYFRDHETGLCFAYRTASTYGGYLAHVPCDKVKNRLVNR